MSKPTSKRCSEKADSRRDTTKASQVTELAGQQRVEATPSSDISSLIHDINNCVMLISILSERFEGDAGMSVVEGSAAQAVSLSEPSVMLRDNITQLRDMLGELYQVLPDRKAKKIILDAYDNAQLQSFLRSKLNEWQLILTPNASVTFINNGFEGCVLMNELALSRCLHNLVRNSGEAHLSAPKNAYELCVNITVSQNNNNVLLIVEDNGFAISGLIERELFERDASSKTSATSNLPVGQGLSSARECIESIGGKIIYDNSFKAGVRFIIALPLLSER